MNFVNRSLAREETRSRVGASERVEASFLPTLDLPGVPASSFYSPEMSAGGLKPELRRVVQDLGAIAKDGGLKIILSNGLADPLGMEL